MIEHETEHNFELIAESKEMKSEWEKYRKKFFYAKRIEFEETLDQVKNLLERADFI